MSAKQIEIRCPCCSSDLVVDVLTARVMRSSSGKAAGPAAADAWASAQEKVQRRTESGPDKLENALEQERGKSQRLDDLFRKARERLQDGKENG